MSAPILGLSSAVSVAAAWSKDTPAEVIGARKTTTLVRARWALMLALRDRGMSYSRIGHWLGGRDHSTVISGCRRGEALTEVDDDFVRLRDQVEAAL